MKATQIMATLGVLALLVLAACQPVVVQPPKEEEKNLITVSSTSEIEIVADQVEVQLGIETTAPDATQSQTRNAEIANAIVQAIKDVGIDTSEISTAQFSVYPRDEWDPKTQTTVRKGYTTTNTVLVKTKKLDLAGKVIDAAATAGANRVNYVQYTLSKAVEEKAKADALKEATSGARSKAQAIADGLDVELGKIASVSEANVYFPPIYARGFEGGIALEAKADYAAAPPVLPGKTTVTATVSVQYNIG